MTQDHVRRSDVDDHQVDHQNIIDRYARLSPFQAHDENDMHAVRNQVLSQFAHLRGRHDVTVLHTQAATLVHCHLGVKHVSSCSISLTVIETTIMMLKK